jgi:hypothetical protein
MVKAMGLKKRQLFDVGKVKINPVVTFKPSAGDPVHDSLRVTLRKH